MDSIEAMNIDGEIDKKLISPSFIKTNNQLQTKLYMLKTSTCSFNRFKSRERDHSSKNKINLKSDEILNMLRANNERNNSIDMVLRRARKFKVNNLTQFQVPYSTLPSLPKTTVTLSNLEGD